VKVAGIAVNAHLAAYVAASSRASHGVENAAGTEEPQQIGDEIATTVAGVTAVAVLTGPVKVIEARQVRHWTSGDRGLGQASVSGLFGNIWFGHQFAATGRKEWIDDGQLGHVFSP
jgi:hypothetical protein